MKLVSRGGAEVWTVTEREGRSAAPSELFPGYEAAAGDPVLHAMGPTVYSAATGRLMHTYQTFVLRWQGKVILIDTCVGEAKARPPHFNYPKEDWPRTLAAAGVKVEEVDHVICTHLHVDHVGWNTRLERMKWVPTFPNATYWFGEEECAHWQAQMNAGDDMAGRIWTDPVLPLIAGGRAQLVPADHDFGMGIRFVPAPGHTPGMFRVDLTTPEGKIIFATDILHNPLQVRFPDLSTVFCTDLPLAARTRRAFFEEVADSGAILLPEHFAYPVAGRIIRQGDGYAYQYESGLIL